MPCGRFFYFWRSFDVRWHSGFFKSVLWTQREG
nr:MAG TPA: hypothetical protein [Caudoviricetes sp.]